MRLLDHQPVYFEFAGPPSEAARRLAAVVHPSIYRCYVTGGLVGRVTEQSVLIARHRPGIHNSFAPVLYAEFQPAQTGTLLVGRFQFSKFVRLFLPAWVGIFSFFVILTPWVEARSSASRPDLLHIIGSFLFSGLVTFALVRLRAPWADEDIEFIRQQVCGALKGAA